MLDQCLESKGGGGRGQLGQGRNGSELDRFSEISHYIILHRLSRRLVTELKEINNDRIKTYQVMKYPAHCGFFLVFFIYLWLMIFH